MEQKHIVKVIDQNKIKSIHFKFPHLMACDADLAIQSEYNYLLELQEELYSLRDRVREVEKEYEIAKEKWNAKKDFVDIEFETTEKEVTTTKSYMTINGKTVYDCNSKR